MTNKKTNKNSYIHSYIKNSPYHHKYLEKLFPKNDPLVIFDIGACQAEDSIKYAKLFTQANIYAFEALKSNFDKGIALIEEYNLSTRISLHFLALSDKKGTATFYVSSENIPNKNPAKERGNKSSSLLPPTENQKKIFSWLSYKEQQEVETERLDTFCQRRGISKIDFIHMDVQGAELMVLQGAGNFLDKVHVLWLEVESLELYENQPLKNDIENFLQKAGFTCILDKAGNVCGDQLYVNKRYYSSNFLFSRGIFLLKIKEKLNSLRHKIGIRY